MYVGNFSTKYNFSNISLLGMVFRKQRIIIKFKFNMMSPITVAYMSLKHSKVKTAYIENSMNFC